MNRIATIPARKYRGKLYVGELLTLRETARAKGMMAFRVLETTATACTIIECSPTEPGAFFPR